ncbi:MAG TPA: hypothetical protein VLG71_02885 [Candidatus Limnocylindria bacterium]|nr:hypothetical protein [Candidatus Limnocylindria bacterium]
MNSMRCLGLLVLVGATCQIQSAAVTLEHPGLLSNVRQTVSNRVTHPNLSYVEYDAVRGSVARRLVEGRTHHFENSLTPLGNFALLASTGLFFAYLCTMKEPQKKKHFAYNQDQQIILQRLNSIENSELALDNSAIHRPYLLTPNITHLFSSIA